MHLCPIRNGVGGFYPVAGTTCLDPLPFNPLRRCTNLALRFQFDALRLKTAMVDAGVYVEFCQPFIWCCHVNWATVACLTVWA